MGAHIGTHTKGMGAGSQDIPAGSGLGCLGLCLGGPCGKLSAARASACKSEAIPAKLTSSTQSTPCIVQNRRSMKEHALCTMDEACVMHNGWSMKE
eukprot:scaffold90590_cov23-Tisochrysis_lutea.AAC.1